MITYSVEHPQKGLISYTDNKRYLWLLSVFMPILALSGIFCFQLTGEQWTLWLPILFSYLVLPILDWLVGVDNNNPPEELVRLDSENLICPLAFLVENLE